MRRRGLILLLGATVLMVALAIVALASGEREVSNAMSGERALPGLAERLGEVATVGVSSSELTASFVRGGEAWRVPEKDGYPADAARIRQVVLALADLTLVEPKTQKPELYPRLEVDDPAAGKSHLLSLKDKAGTTLAALIVGKRRHDRLGAGTDAVYVRQPDAARAWLAAGSLELSGAMSSWLDRHILDIPEKRIAAVSLVAADGSKLAVKRDKPEDKFAVEDLPADAKLKQEDAAGEPAGALDGLELDDVEPAERMPVPESGVITASFATFDGLKVELRLFEHDGKDWAVIAAAGADKAAAEAEQVTDQVSRWAYALPPFKASLLKLKLADLLAPPPKS
jgi:hypothetical protein